MSPDLATALREETPPAPAALRERLAAVATTAPPRRRTPSLRRVLVWAGPAAVAASCLAAVAVGLSSAVDSSQHADEGAATITAPASQLERRAPAEVRRARAEVRRARAEVPAPTALAVAPRASGFSPAPTSARAQSVLGDLQILVDDPNDLSTATQRALRTTRRLGGYVVSLRYGAPEANEGTATLRVRIPRSRVQAAIVRFSGLGRILAQETQITDLQQRLDTLTRQLRRVKGNKAVTALLRRERAAIERRAAYATVDLGLTTHEPETKAAPPGRFERAVGDAAGVLSAELAIGAYILIVASPFLLLLGAFLVGGRAYRRFADQRLLERA